MQKFIKIRKLKTSDASAASRIHALTIPGLSSEIGGEYLKKLYTLLAKKYSNLTFLAEKDHRLVGLTTLSEDISKTSQEMHRLLSMEIYLAVLKKIILLKLSPVVITNRINFERFQTKFYMKPYLAILTLCVSPNYQRHGVGSILIGEVFRLAEEKNVPNVYVDTRESNYQAVKFYEKLGFKQELKFKGNIIFRKQI